MNVHLDGHSRSGGAVDLVDAGLDPLQVVTEVRSPTGAINCQSPSIAHEYIGLLPPTQSLDRRAVLAAIARSRGLSAPQAGDLATVREELDAMDPPSVDMSNVHERIAQTGQKRDRLRERVASLRGHVQARREAGLDTGDAASELEMAVGNLAEVETEYAAAQQMFDQARARSRASRDVRERRFQLEDRMANLERAARAWLADRIRPVTDTAVHAATWSDANAFDTADDVTAAFAAARVADLSAPVVLACRRFPDAQAAADWLNAQVIRV